MFAPRPSYTPVTDRKASLIGYRESSGEISDAQLHEEIMAGVDDSAVRQRSAKRAIEELGLTKEEAEAVFGVQLPD